MPPWSKVAGASDLAVLLAAAWSSPATILNVLAARGDYKVKLGGRRMSHEHHLVGIAAELLRPICAEGAG